VSPASDTRSQPAAIIGVVVAGVLASFVIPGPFGWDTTMLGALLLLILVGYAEVPQRRKEAAALAGATGFALVYLFGHFLDDWLHLSGWPEWNKGFDDNGSVTNVRESLDRPHEGGGWQILLLWTGLTAVVYVLLRLFRRSRSRSAGSARRAEPGP
jgi:hypothetical protein